MLSKCHADGARERYVRNEKVEEREGRESKVGEIMEVEVILLAR